MGFGIRNSSVGITASSLRPSQGSLVRDPKTNMELNTMINVPGDHLTLTNIGTNTHAQIDTALSSIPTNYLRDDAADVGVGLTLTGDNSSADTAYVPMVLYNTDATPPAANTVPIGTIYIQYTP